MRAKFVMKKTPLAGRFLRQLIRVNDQICFSAMQQWDFAKRLDPLVKSSPNQFSASAFPQNPFAETIFRSVQELADFSADAQVVALQMGVVASVEHLLAYVEELQALRETLVATAGDPIFDDALEEQLRLRIARWKGAAPTPEYFRTLGYFRHLRNHYAHVNSQPNAAFSTYTRSYGTPLNKFWDNGRTNLHGIDFRTLPSARLTPDLAFGIMNLLRVCLWHIDDIVADTLSLPDAVRWIVQDIRSIPRNRGMSRDRLVSKVTARLEMEWNLKVEAEVTLKAIETVI